MFKQDPPKTMRPLMDNNDCPELDDTELLPGVSIRHYLTMIGQLKWPMTLWRVDIYTQVIALSRFRSAARNEHLERLQGSMVMSKRPNIILSKTEPRSQTIATFPA